MKNIQITILVKKQNKPKRLKGKKEENFFKKWNKKLMAFVEENSN